MTLLSQVKTLEFWGWIIAAFIVTAIYFGAAKYFNKDTATKKLSAESFRAPVNHVMNSVAVLVPLIVAALAYLFERNPQGQFGTLVAAAAILLLGFAVSTWTTFALVSRTDAAGQVELKFPNDWPYMGIPGVAYAALLVSVVAIAFFFVVRFEISAGQATAVRTEPLRIERMMPRLGAAQTEVQRLLGAPATVSTDGRQWVYRTEGANLQLSFTDSRLVQIIEEAR